MVKEKSDNIDLSFKLLKIKFYPNIICRNKFKATNISTGKNNIFSKESKIARDNVSKLQSKLMRLLIMILKISLIQYF